MGFIPNNLIECCCPCECEQYKAIHFEFSATVDVTEEYEGSDDEGGNPGEGGLREWTISSVDEKFDLPIDYLEETSNCGVFSHDTDEAPDICFYLNRPSEDEEDDGCTLAFLTATFPKFIDELEPPNENPVSGIWPTNSAEIKLTYAISIDVDCEGNGTALIFWSEVELDPENGIGDGNNFGHLLQTGLMQMTIEIEDWAGSGSSADEIPPRTTHDEEGNFGLVSGSVFTNFTLEFLDELPED